MRRALHCCARMGLPRRVGGRRGRRKVQRGLLLPWWRGPANPVRVPRRVLYRCADL